MQTTVHKQQLLVKRMLYYWLFKENTSDDVSRLILAQSGGAEHLDTSGGEGFWGQTGAGVLLMAKDTKRWLVVLRSQEVNEPETWSIPGGAIDDNEKPMSAALREVKEELGYTGWVSNMKLVYTFKNPNGRFRYYNFVGMVDDEFEPTLDWENDGFKWVDLEWLLVQQHNTTLHFGVVALLNNAGPELKRYTAAIT